MLLRHAELPITRWRNGAGRKADVVGGPGWSIGFAWLEAAADFSHYAGQDRTITLLQRRRLRARLRRGAAAAGRPAAGAERLRRRPRLPLPVAGWPLPGGERRLGPRACTGIASRSVFPRPEDTGFAVLLSGSATLPDGRIGPAARYRRPAAGARRNLRRLPLHPARHPGAMSPHDRTPLRRTLLRHPDAGGPGGAAMPICMRSSTPGRSPRRWPNGTRCGATTTAGRPWCICASPRTPPMPRPRRRANTRCTLARGDWP